MTMAISLQVNGERIDAQVPPRLNLADFLREHLHLTGTHVGCEHGVCGACTVRVNGEIVRACLMLAVQADGAEILTVEGLSRDGRLHPIQESFWEKHALQCGFCTPGQLMAIYGFLKSPNRSDKEIRDALSGVLCPCTGYVHIVEAVKSAIAKLDAMAPEERKALFPL